MSTETKSFKNPVATFIPASHNVPVDDRAVFVIAADGEMAVGYYTKGHGGKREWHISNGSHTYFEPFWWAYRPDTSNEATGYKCPEAAVNNPV